MMVRQTLRNFLEFIREQGVVGLAIGFILGTSVSKVVGSLVSDVIQPAIGFIFGSAEGLNNLHYRSIMYGRFIAALIDFTIIAFVVYFGFKALRLERLDKPRERK